MQLRINHEDLQNAIKSLGKVGGTTGTALKLRYEGHEQRFLDSVNYFCNLYIAGEHELMDGIVDSEGKALIIYLVREYTEIAQRELNAQQYGTLVAVLPGICYN